MGAVGDIAEFKTPFQEEIAPNAKRAVFYLLKAILNNHSSVLDDYLAKWDFNPKTDRKRRSIADIIKFILSPFPPYYFLFDDALTVWISHKGPGDLFIEILRKRIKHYGGRLSIKLKTTFLGDEQCL